MTKDLQHYKAVVLSDAHQLITGLETYHSWFIKVLGMLADLTNRGIILLQNVNCVDVLEET